MSPRARGNLGRKQDGPFKASYMFTSYEDIRRALASQSEGALIEALTALRNQLTIKIGEMRVPADDERLLLVKSWLDVSPGAQDIFDIWDRSAPRQHSVIALIVVTLSSLLSLLSSHYTYHAPATPILRSLLSPQYTHKLNSYLGGSHNELLLVTLKLFNSMSDFAGGRERRALLDAFAWETKSLPKLLHMRRKGKSHDNTDILVRPDIRTLFILFILSFVDTTSPTAVKAAFLEQRRDAFTSIFKGFSQDSYSLTRRVLEVCWSGIWSDAKIRRTLKIGLFGETVLAQLVKLYERNSPEDGERDHVPADVVHHFLLAICTRPGVGLCFQDRGWYPRESDMDDGPLPDDRAGGEAGQKGSKIYNKILANVLKLLKVNEDPRQQELAFKILSACPELAAGYWSAAALALEPRLSSKWISNIAFFGSVVSLPVPRASFLLNDDAQLYRPVPPPLFIILENVAPSGNIKTHLSRGMQSPSALVQHCSALALAKCLIKYQAVLDAFAAVETALEEDLDGQWCRRRAELEREIRKRIPDFQVVVGFSQRSGDVASSAVAAAGDSSSAPGDGASQAQKRALLSESAQRLLWLYHRSLPSLVAEARFDAGKLLQASQNVLSRPGINASGGLDTLRQLHVLRLLRESEQFTWSSKTGSHSHLYTLLKIYVSTVRPAVKGAVTSLLRQVFAHSVIFQHDPEEITLWLDSLPTTKRAEGAETPDGVPLTDEGEGVVSFVDTCAQRCSNAPYQYLEELQALGSGHDQAQDKADDSPLLMDQNPSTFPSSLLMTVLEQYGLKLKNKTFSGSDALAVMAFIRKLIMRLASKSPTLHFLERFVAKVEDVTEMPIQNSFSTSPSLLAAVERELTLLRDGLSQLRHLSVAAVPRSNSAVQGFLGQVEHLPVSSSSAEREKSAYELVDWLRIMDCPMQGNEVARLIMTIQRFHAGALAELFEYLKPDEQSLWKSVDLAVHFHIWHRQLSFRTLFLHCDDDSLANPDCRRILVDSLLGNSAQLIEVKRATCLVNHRLLAARHEDIVAQNLLLLLESVMKRARTIFTAEEFSELVETYFASDAFKTFCIQPATGAVRQSLSDLLRTSLNTSMEDNRHVVRDIACLWALTIKDSLRDAMGDKTATALLWAKFLSSDDLLALFDSVTDVADYSSDRLRVVNDLLCTISPVFSANPKAAKLRLQLLLRLRHLLPHSAVLETVLASAYSASLPLCHDGRPLVHLKEGNKALSQIVAEAHGHWLQRLDVEDGPMDINTFLQTDNLTDAAVEIVISVVYRDSVVRSVVFQWLNGPRSGTCSALHLAQILYSLADSSKSSSSLERDEIAILVVHLHRLIRTIAEHANTEGCSYLCSSCAVCVVSMVNLWPSLLPELSKALRKACKSSASDGSSSFYYFSIGRQLLNLPGGEIATVLDVLVDHGLGWAVRYFADVAVQSEAGIAALANLAALLESSKNVKAHLAEPVLAAIIQNGMSDKDALCFARILVQTATLKPVTVNKMLQSIVQHSHLYSSCATPVAADHTTPRDGIIDLLWALFHLHPTNTCQPTHVEPLRRLYGGSLSPSDRKLLSIFQLFEKTRKMSTATLFSSWSSSVDVVLDSTLEAVQNLDPNRIFRTCLSYPNWRHLHEHAVEGKETDALLYDPVFVMLLFAQIMSEGPPTSAVAWVQLFRTNVVSLLIRMLSAKDSDLRNVAVAQVAALYKCLQDADMQEKPHVIHILNLLKDLISKLSGEGAGVARVPAYTTLLLAHALRAVFYPANFIYPLTARFLLQRPVLDAYDVPMLFGMLYSASDQWKKERGWIVRFLSDGMVGTEEWKVLKRRHTWDLLASLFQSQEKDIGLRRGILEVLANITCNGRATTSLLLKGSLLSWIEMQLRLTKGNEGIAWMRILENILCVVNPAKIETSTGGEWRSVLSRCVLMLLENSSGAEGVFTAAISVVLRLSVLPGPPVSRLGSLTARCLSWIKSTESELELPPSGLMPTHLCRDEFVQRPSAPHSSHGLFDKPASPSLRVWGDAVETLWRVSMTLEEKSMEWDELTSRLLIWRSMLGEESKAGEWARREALRNVELKP